MVFENLIINSRNTRKTQQKNTKLNSQLNVMEKYFHFEIFQHFILFTSKENCVYWGLLHGIIIIINIIIIMK